MADNKSFEQVAEDYQRKIYERRHQILDEFAVTYVASLLIDNPEICMQDICLVEQHLYENNAMVTRYWFEYKPEFDDKFRD